MKVEITNEDEFQEYLGHKKQDEYKTELLKLYGHFGKIEYYNVPAGDGFSADRFFIFNLIYVGTGRIVFEFIETFKG